eukprot:CFRG1275T1
MDVVEKILKNHCASKCSGCPQNEGCTGEAAVLIVLFESAEEKGIQVVLTQRSKSLRSHPGEVCLPGGKRDSDDIDIIETALREAHEEISLDKSKVQVVGTLSQYVSKHGLLVTPVVAIASSSFRVSDLNANDDEVALVFFTKLASYLCDKGHKSQEWTMGSGPPVLIHSFEFPNKPRVWGLTAFFLIDISLIVFERQPEFTLSPNIRDTVFKHGSLVKRDICTPGCLKC